MGARVALADRDVRGHPNLIKSLGPAAAIYIFLISFACVFYVLSAPVMLVHYDLGWHLAAGDLIRQHGVVPFQDPWSFTLADKQWNNLS